jgi:hypothetical protein
MDVGVLRPLDEHPQMLAQRHQCRQLVKTLFLQIAAQYRDLAEQIDDPERSRLETRRRVEMFGHLKEHSGAFDPDDIRILVAAFEKAWESIQVGGAIFDTDAKAEAARAILAKHIIAAAKDGERDQGRLRDGALVALAQSNLRTAPRSRR